MHSEKFQSDGTKCTYIFLYYISTYLKLSALSIYISRTWSGLSIFDLKLVRHIISIGLYVVRQIVKRANTTDITATPTCYEIDVFPLSYHFERPRLFHHGLPPEPW